MRENTKGICRRWLAILLCFCMLMSSGNTVLLAGALGAPQAGEQSGETGGSNSDTETKKEEPILEDKKEPAPEKKEEEIIEAEQVPQRKEQPVTEEQPIPEIKEEPVADKAPASSEPVVYWNPVKEAAADTNSGQKPEESIETFGQALAKARELEQTLNAPVTIYAMGTQVITKDTSAVYDGSGVAVEVWSQRSEDDTAIFRIESGDLTLKNLTLNGPKDKDLVSVEAGTLHLGRAAAISGQVQLNALAGLQKGFMPQIVLEDDFDGSNGYILSVKAEEGQKPWELLVNRNNTVVSQETMERIFRINDSQKEKYGTEWKDNAMYVFGNKAMQKASRAATTVYWNPTTTPIPAPDGSTIIAPGNDINDGSTSSVPVLTWQSAKAKAAGGTIIVMSNINIGDVDAQSAGLPDNTLSLDGEGVTLMQWSYAPEEIFLVGEGTSLTLKNINMEAAQGYEEDSILRVKQGTLTIAEGVRIGGVIYTELNQYSPDWMSPVIFSSQLPEDVKYKMYFTSIEASLANQCVNVGKPDPTWKGLLDHLILSEKNAAEGWTLRYQTRAGGIDPSNDNDGDLNVVELYRVYNYSGIYLNGVTGNDQNFGGNCLFPVKTFKRAKELLKMGMNGSGTIYICDTVTIEAEENWNLPKPEFPDARVELCVIKNHEGEAHTTPTEKMIIVPDDAILTTEEIGISYVHNNTDSNTAERYVNVWVDSGGTYTMGEGTILDGNKDATYTNGSSIVAKGSSNKKAKVLIKGGKIEKRYQGIKTVYSDFSMEGGEVNSNYYSGFNMENSTMALSGGSIAGNGSWNGYGGILAYRSELTMTDGIIQENKGGYNGGVEIRASKLTMSGGSIERNQAMSTPSTVSDTSNFYGGGIKIQSSSEVVLKGTAKISGNTTQTVGGGISVDGPAKLTIEGGEISNNTSKFYGGGVFSVGSLAITGGRISGNVVTAQQEQPTVGGGGIYARGQLQITGGKIEQNLASAGGGILTRQIAPAITGAQIRNNDAVLSGGGIQIEEGYKAQSNITRTIFEENRAGTSGGAINYDGYIGAEDSLDKKEYTDKLSLESCTFTENEATRGSGGAVFIQRGNIEIFGESKSSFTNNKAASAGGALCAYKNNEKKTISNISKAEFRGNQSNDGGAVFLGFSETTLTDVTMSANTAASDVNNKGRGGAINQLRGSVQFVNAQIADNTAVTGGSVYLECQGELLSGSISGGTSSGSQKKAIYLNVSIDSGDVIYLDPEEMRIQDGVYMNTATSKLWLLDGMPAGQEIKVAVNSDKFIVGSVIVAPSKNVELGNTSYNCEDVSGFVNQFTAEESAGEIPIKTTIGGFGKNIILVGEGVYLSGEGNDQNTGMDPANAVQTFEKAKEILLDKIQEAETVGETFEPYIYICGTVTVSGESTWTLPQSGAGIFLPDGPNYEKGLRKVLRFASYYGTMVSVPKGSALTLQNIVMDGNKLGVDGVHNAIGPIVAVNGQLTVTDAADVTANYQANISVSGEDSKVTITGEGTGGRVSYPHTDGIYAANGAAIVLEKNGHIDSAGEEINYDDTLYRKIGAWVANAATLTMKDDSYIHQIETGLYVGAGGEADLTENTKIYDCREGIYSIGGNTRVYGNTSIKNCSYGIWGTGTGDVALYGAAKIEGSTKGTDGYHGNTSSVFRMYENAVIEGMSNGVFLGRGAPKATVEGAGIIRKSNNGFYTMTERATDNPHITVGGQAVITDCKNGISINNEKETQDSIGTTTVLIKEDAQFNGSTTDGTASRYGIINNGSGASVTMEGNGVMKNYASGGIHIKTAVKDNVDGTISLKGSASIQSNGGDGISVVQGDEKFHSNWQVDMSGQSSVNDNSGRGIHTYRFSEIILGEGISISGNSENEPGRAGSGIYTHGQIKLKGGALISDEIHPISADKPIVLTGPVPEGNRFKLGGGPNFTGQPIVKPDGSNVTDASIYLGNFEGTSNLPNDVGLGKREEYIVLGAGKDVYIAGDGNIQDLAPGNDSNNGLSKAAPVRTFKKAKEILEGSKGGGNIYICNYTVEIEAGDEAWEFDEAGIASNGVTWTPHIIREADLKGRMLEVKLDGAASLTIKNTVIDGNAEKAGTVQGEALKIGKIPQFALTVENVQFRNHHGDLKGVIQRASAYKKDIPVPAIVLSNQAQGGSVSLRDTVFENNRSEDGASIVSVSHKMVNTTIKSCDFSNNYIRISENGGDILGTLCISGKSAISDSSFTENVLYFNYMNNIDPHVKGSALCFWTDDSEGSLEIKNCIIKDNRSIGENRIYGLVYAPLYFSGGTANVVGGEISGNRADEFWKLFGGGISADAKAAVTVDGTLIKDNTLKGSGTNQDAAGGGGIHSQGNLSVRNAVITNNKVEYTYGIGGGIWSAFGGTLKLENTTLTGNYSEHNGGGIGLTSTGAATIENTSVQQNKARNGGGISLTSPATTIVKNNLITENSAVSSGGGIYQTNGTLRINSANIDGNTAQSSGGGVFTTMKADTQFMGGGIQNNTAKNEGAGIYYEGGSVSISGGRIEKNHSIGQEPSQKGRLSGIYVKATNFQIKGGGSVIEDYIYLSGFGYPIILSGSIYQKGRLYKLSLSSEFKKGNVVVKPDNSVITNATQYHKYFEASIGGLILEKGSPNLILKQCVFIDSIKGNDRNQGDTPNSAVKTFKRAKEVCSNKDSIIYVSGQVNIASNEPVWELDSSCSVCRYTGFGVNGTKYEAYDGDMIVLDKDAVLTTQNIDIYGRRDIDDVRTTGSIVKVLEGGSFNMNAETSLGRNKTADKGGAILIDKGAVSIEGGRIFETQSVEGSAIYQNGSLNLANTISIAGNVYLEGTGNQDESSRFIGVAQSYSPAKGEVLKVSMRNAFATRHVVHYPESYVPSADDLEKYQLDADVLAVYRFYNRQSKESILELQQKGIVYIDGTRQYGDDSHSGATPRQSVATIKKAYEILEAQGREGGLVIVVGTVPVNKNIKLVNVKVNSAWEAYYKEGDTIIDVGLPVMFQRYSQPTKHASLPNADQYDVESFKGTLFEIKQGGYFDIQGTAVDGHSKAISGPDYLAAPPVEAVAPVYTIERGGILRAYTGSTISNNNNVLTGGKGGAVNIQDGTADLEGVDIKNVNAEIGSAICQEGTLWISRQPVIEGEIFLGGNGTTADKTSSHYIHVKLMGFKPKAGSMEIRFDDVYNGRPIALYPGENILGEDIEVYHTTDAVRDIYTINKRNEEPKMLELQLKPAVYIDGVAGDDTNSGISPDEAVKTLEKAYSILKEIRGGALYVVDTVTIGKEITISNKSYEEVGKIIEIQGAESEIRRYVQPDAHGNLTGFTHGTNVNGLFAVEKDAALTINNLVIDGHKERRADGDLLPQVVVTQETSVSNPLIEVRTGGKLYLYEKAVLKNNRNNSNTLVSGGAAANYGELYFSSGVLSGNEASKGAGIYQHGTLTVEEGVSGIGDQEIYLATNNGGTADVPEWGEDYFITLQDMIPEGMKLNINMDHAVRTRNVAVFDNASAFADSVGNEISKFNLGTTVPVLLPLIESKESSEPDTLELHDYTDVLVTVVWEDHDNLDNTRPEGPVTVSVKDGATTAGTVDVVKAAGNTWTGTLKDLNKYYDPAYDTEVVYEIDAPNASKYTKAYDQDNHKVTYSYIPQRTLTYDGNGATAGQVPAAEASYGYDTEITVEQNKGSGAAGTEFVKDGCQFAGWNTMADGGGRTYQPGSTLQIQENTTLYAMWVKAEKSSDIIAADGILRPGEELVYTIQVTVPAESNTVTITDVIPTGTAYVAGSATAPAQYAEDTKILTWEYNDVTAQTEIAVSFKVKTLDTLANGAEVVNRAEVTIGSNTFTTNEVKNAVEKAGKVLYDGNGNTAGTVPVDHKYYVDGDSAVVKANDGNGNAASSLKKIETAGAAAKAYEYTFTGWNTKSDGTGTHYNPSESIDMGGETITLYAMWQKTEKTSEQAVKDGILKPGEILNYKITISVPDGNASAVVTDTIPANTTYVNGSANYGGTFSGNVLTWNLTKEQLKNEVTLSFQVRVNAGAAAGTNILNQASVKIGANTYNTNSITDTVDTTYRLLYDGNKPSGAALTGKAPTDEKYYASKEQATVAGNTGDGTPDSLLVCTDYHFAGWNTRSDGSGTHYDAGDSVEMTSSVTLYAVWVEATKSSTQENTQDILKPGEKITYTIDLFFPEATRKVVVTDKMPVGTTYVGGTVNENGTYDGATKTITWNLTDIPAKTSKSLSFVVSVNSDTAKDTTVTNKAQMVLNEKYTFDTNPVSDVVGTTYKITYDGNGETAGVPPVDRVHYVDGTEVTVLGNIGDSQDAQKGPMHRTETDSHAVYTFAGWNTEADGSGDSYSAGGKLEIHKDVVLYAMWVRGEKTSTEEVDDGLLKPGEKLTYTISVTTPEGAEQIAITDSIPAGTAYVSGSANPDAQYSNGKLTWTINDAVPNQTHQLTFQVTVNKTAAAGSSIPNKVQIIIGEHVYESNTTRNEVGETFRVLYDDNNATGGIVPKDDTFYESAAQVTVKGNDGNGTEADKLYKNNALFMGWNTDPSGNGTHFDSGAEFAITEDTTLFAMWATAEKSSRKVSSGEGLRPGDILHYTIEVDVPESTDTITVRDRVPDNTSYVEYSAVPEGTVNGQEIQWQFNNLSPGEKVTMTFDVEVKEDASPGDLVVNVADVIIGGNSFTTNTDTKVIGEFYKVAYFANGGKGSVPVDSRFYGPQAEVTVKENAGTTASPVPLSREGYEFIGWNTKNDGMGTAYKPGSTFSIERDMELYAMWLGVEKTATEEYPESILKPGEALTYSIELKIPEKVTRITVTDKIPANTSYVEGSVNEGGSFQEANQTVTWEFDNLTAGETKTLRFTVAVSDTLGEGNTISNTGKITIGENEYHTTTRTDTIGKTYRVNYHGNGNTEGIAPLDQHLYAAGEVVTVLGNMGRRIRLTDGPLEKLDSHFAGWNTKADGTGTSYQEDDILTIRGDVDLYAMWVTAKKAATEQVEDGSLRPGEKVKYVISVDNPTQAESLTITDRIPENTSFVDGSAGNGVYENGVITWSYTNVAANAKITVEFYVQVKENLAAGTEIRNQAQISIGENTYKSSVAANTVGTTFRLTYDKNEATGGVVPKDKNYYTAGEEALVNGNTGNGDAALKLIREGYQFAAWNTKPDGTGEILHSGDRLTMTADTTLYAVWLKAVKSSKQEIDDGALKAGEKLTYAIELTMADDQRLVTVTDTIPEGTNYVEGSATRQGVYKNGVITWEIENARANDVVRLEFDVTVSGALLPGTAIDNMANIRIGMHEFVTNQTRDVVGDSFTVTYNANGGTGSVPLDSHFYAKDELVAVQSNNGGGIPENRLVKEGFTFAGWNTQEDGNGTTYFPDESFRIQKSEILYAMWMKSDKTSEEETKDQLLRPGEILTYTITATIPYAQDKVVITDTIPTGTKYVKDSAGSGVYKDGTITWTFENVRMGQELNASFMVKVADTAMTGTDIRNEANIIIGENVFKTTMTKDTVAETYQVVYHKNGAQSGKVPVDATHYAPGEKTEVLGNDGNGSKEDKLVKKGEAFAGWNTKADGSGETYQAEDELVMNSPVDLYAMWLRSDKKSEEKTKDGMLKPDEIITYTIKATLPYDSTKVIITDAIPKGTAYVKDSAGDGIYKDNVLTWTFENVKKGRELEVTFQVKVLETTATGTEITNQAQISIGDNTYRTVTTRDIVKETYQLVYDKNGADSGKVPEDTTQYKAGEKAEVSENNGNHAQIHKLTKKGEEFAGWNTKADGTGKNFKPGDKLTMNGPVTLYAMWIRTKKASQVVAGDGVLRPGGELAYTITAKIPYNQKRITITDTIPAGTEFVEGSASSGTYQNGRLTWVFVDVKAGSELKVEFRVKVKSGTKAGTKIENQAQVNAGGSSYQTEKVSDKVENPDSSKAPKKPTPTGNAGTSTNKKGAAGAKTGDPMNGGAWAAVLFAAGGFLGIYVQMRRRKRKKK